MIDAHLHLWQLAPGRYTWLNESHGPLHANFTAEAAKAELDAAGIGAAILVQAEDSDADTDFMLDVAAENPYVVGVVGWVNLEAPANAAARLEALSDPHAGLVGIRHLVHDDPRDDFLQLPQVRESIALVAEAGLAFDVPDAWPRHLGQLGELADAVPGLRLVIDHLGKPPRGTDRMTDWEHHLRDAARREGVVAKISGLQQAGQPFTVESLRPVWEVALDAFGPERLIYGGDWPMTVPDGGYQRHWQVIAQLVGELTDSEQSAILDGTARRTYLLNRSPYPNEESSC